MELFRVAPEKITYTDASSVDPGYTERMDREYTWLARVYDALLALFPRWRRWIEAVVPYIEGPRVLEVSFGSGYLMTCYAGSKLDVCGVDYNVKMAEVTSRKMASRGIAAQLLVANAERLPFCDRAFDTLINTMALTGYPDGDTAVVQFYRVLRPKGRLLLVDFDYPEDRSRLGYWIVRLWARLGDVIKDIDALLARHGFEYQHATIGGFGSVHLYVATRPE